MTFIRHRTAENNQRHLSHGFKNILFSDNMHYVDLFPIGVFVKSGTTEIWGGAFAPAAPPLATPLICHYCLIFHKPLILPKAAPLRVYDLSFITMVASCSSFDLSGDFCDVKIILPLTCIVMGYIPHRMLCVELEPNYTVCRYLCLGFVFKMGQGIPWLSGSCLNFNGNWQLNPQN